MPKLSVYVISFLITLSLCASDKNDNGSRNNGEAWETFLSLMPSMGCGICRKVGGDTFWYTSSSFLAHKECFQKIQSTEQNAWSKISKKYADTASRNNCHGLLIKKVQKGIQEQKGKELTIKEYLDAEGKDKLKKLFDESITHILKD